METIEEKGERLYQEILDRGISKELAKNSLVQGRMMLINLPMDLWNKTDEYSFDCGKERNWTSDQFVSEMFSEILINEIYARLTSVLFKKLGKET